jgi:hypothetical protein
MKHADRPDPRGRRATTEAPAGTPASETVDEAASAGSRHRLQRWRYASAVQAARAINVLGSRSPAGPDGHSSRLAD